MKTDVNFYRKPGKRDRFLNFEHFVVLILVACVSLFIYHQLIYQGIQHQGTKTSQPAYSYERDSSLGFEDLLNSIYSLDKQRLESIGILLDLISTEAPSLRLNTFDLDARSKLLVINLGSERREDLLSWLAVFEINELSARFSLLNMQLDSIEQAWSMRLSLSFSTLEGVDQ